MQVNKLIVIIYNSEVLIWCYNGFLIIILQYIKFILILLLSLYCCSRLVAMSFKLHPVKIRKYFINISIDSLQ